MNLVLRAVALKVINKTAGPRPDQKRTDYVVFNCPDPRCGQRNKQSLYEAQNYLPSDENWIPFKCKKCGTTVEVQPPAKAGSLIVSPDDFAREMAQRRKELSVSR